MPPTTLMLILSTSCCTARSPKSRARSFLDSSTAWPIPKKCATVGQCANQMTERQRNRWKGDPHYRPDKPVLNKVATPEEATHAMNDRNFTKFVFFRDPAERLLSAYLDKFEHGSRYRVGYGLRIFKDPKMNFSGFVEALSE